MISDLCNFVMYSSQDLFSSWGGVYCDLRNSNFLKVEVSKDEMIISFHQKKNSPPSLVTRVHPVKIRSPFQMSLDPSFAIVRSDFEDVASAKVLQKIEIVIDSAPSRTEELSIKISEFEAVRDFFDEIPPDDPKKCRRKFKIRKMGDCFLVSLVCKQSGSFREFLMRKVGEERISRVEEEDRSVIAEEARKLFRLYHDEVWLVNNGILIQYQAEVEKELGPFEKREIVNNSVAVSAAGENIPWLTLEEIDSLVTEEELIMKRDFDT